MSQFSRPARWLRQLFTPSATGFQEPGTLSTDVSLIQPYDGGGYPFETRVQRDTQAAVAANTVTIISANINEIIRLMGLSILVTAGTIPTIFFLVLLDGVELAISPRTVISAINQQNSVIHNTPILPPEAALQVSWAGGNASTVVRSEVLFVRAPIGTVFYV